MSPLCDALNAHAVFDALTETGEDGDSDSDQVPIRAERMMCCSALLCPGFHS